MKSAFAKFDSQRDVANKPFKSLCYAPFVQLEFSPNGEAAACCVSRSHPLGNVRDHRLDEIWNGKRMQLNFCLMRQNPQLSKIVTHFEDTSDSVAKQLTINRDSWLEMVAGIRGRAASQDESNEAALKVTDRHPEVYLRKAWLEFAKEQFDDALDAVERAEELAAKIRNAEAWLIEGLALVGALTRKHTGNIDEALVNIDAYPASKPDQAGAREVREAIVRGE